MTDEESAAARRYQQDVRDHPEVMTDGYGESVAEHGGITRVRHVLIVALTAVVSLIAGASIMAGVGWWSTRPDPAVQALNIRQYEALLAAADPNSRGFNDGAIGTLVANGWTPVAQSVDGNTDTFYVVLAKVTCTGDFKACAKHATTSPDPVVYLGLPDELTDNPQAVRFAATRVQVDFPLGGDRVQRCAIYRGKALAGEPGPVTYNLHQTIAALRSFAGEREFTDESPDGDASFWSCGPVDRS